MAELLMQLEIRRRMGETTIPIWRGGMDLGRNLQVKGCMSQVSERI
ncbi:MAG: hypothetical protein WBA22_04190 [Candidatus Methanofastidiosia archaeon]